MPHYFFDLHNHVSAVDNEGADHADHNAAIAHATLSARRIMADDIVRLGELDRRHWIEIRHGTDDWRYRVLFGDCIRVLP
ncbi:DUF6894 family protein [Sphingomonas panacisoli]|uniref:DUF6894 family protein n=1 Tax=Sphingomonas panacisoli TaxID=1813879 RepID=UPI003B8493D3